MKKTILGLNIILNIVLGFSLVSGQEKSIQESFSSPHLFDNRYSYIQVWTPPQTQVQLPNAVNILENQESTHFIFKADKQSTSGTLYIEGPFGGKIEKEIAFNQNPFQEIFIEEERWLESSNNPEVRSGVTLPQLCPRLLPKDPELRKAGGRQAIVPEQVVYDGSKDFFSYTTIQENEILWLKKASLNFDFEDPSLLLGFDTEGNAYYEQGGGFYSNIHYVLFPYSEKLEGLYQEMEKDWIKLRTLEMKIAKENPNLLEKKKMEEQMKAHLENIRGTPHKVGPHQTLMNLFFQTHYLLPDQSSVQDFPRPIVHGFLPGPFLGSTHLGYNLCEWGDTAIQIPQQEVEYENYALGKWDKSKPDEKMILMLLEGDDQMKKNLSRLNLEKKGVLQKWDYADDLIGFFVISKKENSQGDFKIRSPLGEIELVLETK